MRTSRRLPLRLFRLPQHLLHSLRSLPQRRVLLRQFVVPRVERVDGRVELVQCCRKDKSGLLRADGGRVLIELRQGKVWVRRSGGWRHLAELAVWSKGEGWTRSAPYLSSAPLTSALDLLRNRSKISLRNSMLRSLTPRQLPRSHSLTCRRTIWLTSTILSTSPSSLLSHLQRTPPPADSSVLFYAISKNVPSSLISSIQASLSPTPSIGCISEVLSPALSTLLAPSLSSSSETYSVSLASFHPTSSSRAVPFLSTLSGRPNISVGREIKSGPREDKSGETIDGGFEAFLSGKKWGFGEGPAEGRRGVIEELKGVP